MNEVVDKILHFYILLGYNYLNWNEIDLASEFSYGLKLSAKTQMVNVTDMQKQCICLNRIRFERSKIEKNEFEYIKTVYGMGYMWIGGQTYED